MYILLMLDEVVYICQSNAVVMIFVSSTVFLMSFYLLNLFISGKGY